MNKTEIAIYYTILTEGCFYSPINASNRVKNAIQKLLSTGYIGKGESIYEDEKKFVKGENCPKLYEVRR